MNLASLSSSAGVAFFALYFGAITLIVFAILSSGRRHQKMTDQTIHEMNLAFAAAIYDREQELVKALKKKSADKNLAGGAHESVESAREEMGLREERVDLATYSKSLAEEMAGLDFPLEAAVRYRREHGPDLKVVLTPDPTSRKGYKLRTDAL